MERFICIHGHFYQPPRENPWLEEVELQDSAYPYHDWNERITAQCYAPNSASRILDPEQRIIDIVNNYSKISFNFGPTLLAWLERRQPEVHEAIVEADRLSRKRFSGHGSAMAQVYNHIIMPLANKRDKHTQVIWGMEDFRKRFGRDAEGMWLAETAVDLETLEVLAEHGIRYTILAPNQAHRVRRIAKNSAWIDVENGRIDPSTAYVCPLPSGRTINLFFYDGPISHDVAFGDLLNSGEAFARRLVGAFSDERDWPQLVHISTDGETFGHHHRHGEMALAYCLYFIESQNLARLTNYGEFLEKHPPTHCVEIFENSSWSCIHGVERWREDCGCHSGMHPGWNQTWRSPLREAMNRLRDTAATLFSDHAMDTLRAPWEARNDYIRVIMDRSGERLDAFFRRHAVKELSPEERRHALCLLEMQRHALLMFTSCGWFFDEVSGIETVQVMQYAAKVIHFAERFGGEGIEAEFVRRLAETPSNVLANAAEAYELYVKTAVLDLLRVGVHYAVSSLFEDYEDEARIFCYTVLRNRHHVASAGKLRLVIGGAEVVSEITGESQDLCFAVVHLGDHNLSGGVRPFQAEEAFTSMESEIRAAFDKGDIPEVIRLIDKHFEVNNFSIWHLFRDGQRKVIDQILELTYRDVHNAYGRIYESAQPIMNFLSSLSIPLPKDFSAAAERVINTTLKNLLAAEDLDEQALENLIAETNRWHLSLDAEMFTHTAGDWINKAIERIRSTPDDLKLLEKTHKAISLLSSLPLDLDVWKAQNTYFSLTRTKLVKMQKLASKGDRTAQEWVRLFKDLAEQLKVKGSWR